MSEFTIQSEFGNCIGWTQKLANFRTPFYFVKY